MKTKLLIWAIFMLMRWSVFSWQLPLQEISEPSCKSQLRSAHSNECKRDFILPKENVVSWTWNTIQKLLFSVLYESSYIVNDWFSWGHPWIDIVSAKWTPIYAISEWEIIKSDYINGYWNTIVLKIIDDEETVFANYAHLDERLVSNWDIVKEWDIMWYIGNTWFTIGPLWNHLDFQITTSSSPSHPYAYVDCKSWYRDAVQKWLCKDQLYLATHNPFEFLHKKIEKQNKIVELIDTQTTTTKKTTPVNEVQQKYSILEKIDLEEIMHNKKKKLTQNTYKPSSWVMTKSWIIVSHELHSTQLETWRLGKLHLNITQDGQPYSWLLWEPIRIKTNNDNLVLYMDEFKFISKWKKDILLHGKKQWKTILSIYKWDKVINTIDLTIL